MRRWPSPSRCSVAATAPSKFCASTVGRNDPPRCGSTATTGWVALTSTTVGVTRMMPSVECATEAGEVAALPALLGAHPRVDHQLVVRPVERVGDALQQFGAEWLDVGDQHADDVRALAAQAAGDEARLVAEFVDDVLDPGDGARGDAVAPVDDARDGGDRDVGACGHVADRHSGPVDHRAGHRCVHPP